METRKAYAKAQLKQLEEEENRQVLVLDLLFTRALLGAVAGRAGEGDGMELEAAAELIDRRLDACRTSDVLQLEDHLLSHAAFAASMKRAASLAGKVARRGGKPARDACGAVVDELAEQVDIFTNTGVTWPLRRMSWLWQQLAAGKGRSACSVADLAAQAGQKGIGKALLALSEPADTNEKAQQNLKSKQKPESKPKPRAKTRPKPKPKAKAKPKTKTGQK